MLENQNLNFIYPSIIDNNTEKTEDNEKLRYYLKVLQDVLRGITDIIGVYTPDNTIMFYNEAGYEFYNKTPEETNGKKCYEMLCRRSRCNLCATAKCIISKNIVRLEKYIPELNRYMDCCSNPILDENGKVILVVEQLRDITEKKVLENLLKESEEKYRRIVDLSPQAIIIICEGKVVLANDEALKLYGVDSTTILGQPILNYISPIYHEIFKKRYSQITNKESQSASFDYEMIRYDKTVINIEATSKFFNYNGKPALQTILHNITDKKTELKKAALLQRQSLQNFFPLEDKMRVESTYVAARTVSGDFYHIHKVNDSLVIGILIDVCGKGITAALNVSALNVLFHEVLLNCQDPLKIVQDLNFKVGNYLNETYIAVSCFSLDFQKNIAKVVGGGIGQFLLITENSNSQIRTVPGAFLGMFEDSIFQEELVHFKTGDTFYFYTDGLDFLFDDILLREKFSNASNEVLKNYVRDMVSNVDGLKDDCTLLKIIIN
ncbi:MAG: PAS domain S-box protein [Clostridiaceae bacterium]|nr:PAS domain S-box protein [Clostridiaceae bacterium]